MTRYGASLPSIEAERVDRRDEQLLHRALLALAHDRDRGEHHRDDLQQDRDEARDDVVRGAAVGVEQDDRLRARAAGRAAAGACATPSRFCCATRPLIAASACALPSSPSRRSGRGSWRSSPRARLSWKSGGITTPTRARPARSRSRASCGFFVTLRDLERLRRAQLIHAARGCRACDPDRRPPSAGCAPSDR